MVGIVFSVGTFWLIVQKMLTIGHAVKAYLGISSSSLNNSH